MIIPLRLFGLLHNNDKMNIFERSGGLDLSRKMIYLLKMLEGYISLENVYNSSD